MDVELVKSNLSGDFRIPPSKSHSMRALVLACFADGVSHIDSLLYSDDTKACIAVFCKLGCHIDILRLDNCSVDVRVQPPSGGLLFYLQNTTDAKFEIECGNSGTLLYFLAVIFSFVKGVTFTFSGDVSLSKRPLMPIVELYEQRGVFYKTNNSHLPLTVQGNFSDTYSIFLSGKFSQVVSGLFLATAIFSSKLELTLSYLWEAPYIVMTKQWLFELGITFDIFDTSKKFFLLDARMKSIKGFEKKILADWSSAAFPLLMAISSQSPLCLTHLFYDSVQGDMAILTYLREFGCNFDFDTSSARLHVLDTSFLKGSIIDIQDTPDLLPVIAAIASFAVGRTKIYNLGITQYKESNRVLSTISVLTKFGCSCYEKNGALVIENAYTQSPDERIIDTFFDHRIALTACALALAYDTKTLVKDCQCYSVSFPNFFDDLKKCGGKFKLYE